MIDWDQNYRINNKRKHWSTLKFQELHKNKGINGYWHGGGGINP